MRVLGQATPATPSFIDPKTAVAGKDIATQAPPPERVAQAVKQLNDAFTQRGQNLKASVEKDEATGISVVKVIDKNTLEEISQFPSKEIIAIAASIDRDQKGKGQLIHVSA